VLDACVPLTQWPFSVLVTINQSEILAMKLEKEHGVGEFLGLKLISMSYLHKGYILKARMHDADHLFLLLWLRLVI
jgi:hypothetical protein